MSPEHREIRESLGAWAMGHLDAAESEMVDRHLERCAACRDEAASLRRTGRLLELLDPEAAGSLSEPLPEPSPDLEARVMSGMRDPAPAASPSGERGRRRWWIALPVAGALAAVAVALVLTLGGGGRTGPDGRGQEFAFASLPSGVTIDGNLDPRATGTGIEVRVDGMRPGTLCRVYVKTRGGKLEPAGTFRYRYDAAENESYPATLSTARDLSDIEALVIKAGKQTFSTNI